MTLNPDAIRQTWMCEAIGKDSFIALSKKPASEQVSILGTRLDVIERGERETFFEKGVIVIFVERTRLWAEWPNPKEEGKCYHSFDAWMGGGEGGETCRTSRYDARTFVQETRELPPEVVKKIARKNSKKFLDIPPKRRSEPKVLEAACTLSRPQFDAFVEKHVPEAHSERIEKVTFSLERSQRMVVDETVARGMARFGLTSPAETLTAICIEIQHEWDREDQAEAQERARAVGA